MGKKKGGTYKYEKHAKSWPGPRNFLQNQYKKSETLNNYENEFLLIDLNNRRTAKEINDA